jgi:hypothetical protein
MKQGRGWRRRALEEADRGMRWRRRSMMKLSNKPFDIFSLSVLNPSSIL